MNDQVSGSRSSSIRSRSHRYHRRVGPFAYARGSRNPAVPKVGTMTGVAFGECGAGETVDIETVRVDTRSAGRGVVVVGQGIDGLT